MDRIYRMIAAHRQSAAWTLLALVLAVLLSVVASHGGSLTAQTVPSPTTSPTPRGLAHLPFVLDGRSVEPVLPTPIPGTAQELPRPAGLRVYGACAPQFVGGVYQAQPTWWVLVCGWRNNVFGNYVYRIRLSDSTATFVDLQRPTAGRGTLVVSGRSLYLLTSEESASGARDVRMVIEQIGGYAPLGVSLQEVVPPAMPGLPLDGPPNPPRAEPPSYLVEVP